MKISRIRMTKSDFETGCGLSMIIPGFLGWGLAGILGIIKLGVLSGIALSIFAAPLCAGLGFGLYILFCFIFADPQT